jgi:hypothetical protein
MEKAFVNVSAALPSDAQPSVLVKPSVCALDYPSIDTKSAAIRCVSSCDVGNDASQPQAHPMRVRVVPSIRIQACRPLSRPAACPAQCGNAVDSLIEEINVRNVACRKQHHQRHTLAVGDHMVLAPRPATIDRTWPAFFPPHHAHAHGLSQLLHGPSRCGLIGAGARARRDVVFATRHAAANPEADASRSCQNHSLAPAEGIPTGYRS